MRSCSGGGDRLTPERSAAEDPEGGVRDAIVHAMAETTAAKAVALTVQRVRIAAGV